MDNNAAVYCVLVDLSNLLEEKSIIEFSSMLFEFLESSLFLLEPWDLFQLPYSFFLISAICLN